MDQNENTKLQGYMAINFMGKISISPGKQKLPRIKNITKKFTFI